MEVAAPALNLGMEPLELEACRRGVALLTGDRYDVIRPIGRGGMSVVLLGLDRQEGRRVALKLLDPAQGASVENRERFRREALISAELEHPHIVPCYQFVHHSRLALAIMRYIPGRSLADRLGDDGRMSPTRTLSILIPMVDALAHAHRNGVVHRDVKPDNILMQDEDDWPFLTDFGIATLRTSDHSRSEVGKGFGTPAFMSPEQALGSWEADFRTDIYSLGLVAYRMLAGRLPFTGQSAISLAAQRTARNAAPLRELAPDVPADLAAIVDRCVVREPKGRWKSADALYSAMVRSRSRLVSDGSRSSSLLNRFRAFVAGELGRHTPTPLPL
ncbi:MAG TPA: serine/threonine-protein kinase [Gemmatimonadales bacterium]|nr:serine/threonine-protein kinase [Gemmatimonadales bacterium]